MKFVNYFSLFYIVLLLCLINGIPLAISAPQDNYKTVSSEEQILSGELPMGYNSLFAGSGECLQCHDEQVNSQGEFIGIISDWRSSMMANSSKDPFWRAKVSHETLVNPEHAELLEDVCTRCHAPLGNFNAHFNGQEFYSIAEMETDSLARDGVSCTLCHQIMPESLGNYSGEMLIGENKTIWGPYQNPFGNPMINHTGYTPTYSSHIEESQLCGSCHTLLTPTIDYEGNITGTYFPEQAIYHEWLNSNFKENNITCQKCHMPHIDDLVQISSMPPWLDGRTPFAKHHLAGANVFMLKLLKENMEVLGITATEQQLDSTINRAKRMLQQSSLTLELTETSRTSDTLFLELALTNLSGHKFPTGYPSRRAFIELFVVDGNDTIFHSGEIDNEFNIVGEDDTYEPHHAIINDPADVQIYEMVMGDVNLEPTTVLAYAYQHLKDNRIPPAGFTSAHFAWDTVAVSGLALNDADFNKNEGVEGSGSDNVKYHIPLNGNNGLLSIKALVHYQTVSNKWLEHMFSYTSGEIDNFKSMYESADKTPVVIGEALLSSVATSVPERDQKDIQVYPNPGSGLFQVFSDHEINLINVYDQSGQLMQTFHNFASVSGGSSAKFQLDEPSGIYLVEMLYANQNRTIKKIILNR
ncbi:MAG TPA: T9SS type A sorting domain-containing protein [Bacteroidales bacterium]|nr:T9SS type A sorting domain-containing protein [Bacteroidales bacterium]